MDLGVTLSQHGEKRKKGTNRGKEIKRMIYLAQAHAN